MGEIISIRPGILPKRKGKYDHIPTEEQMIKRIIAQHKKKQNGKLILKQHRGNTAN